MKKIIFFGISLFLSIHGNSQSLMGKIKYEDLRKKVVFRLSPFHFIDHSIQIQGEFFTSNSFKNSLQISLVGMYQDEPTRQDNGISLELQGKYYPRSFASDTMPWIRNKAAGLYLGYGTQLGINESSDSYTTNMSTLNTIKYSSVWITPFFCFGYQMILWETLYLDVYLGGGIKINDVTQEGLINPNENYQENPDIFNRHYKGIIPKIGFTFGIGI